MLMLIDMKATLMIVLCSAAILVSGCATSHSHSTAWEYKVFDGYMPSDLENRLNHLGSEGWVVVSSSSSVSPPNSPQVLIILKRHK